MVAGVQYLAKAIFVEHNMNTATDQVLFRETQRFGRFSVWIICSVTILGIVAVGTASVISQLDLIPETKDHVGGTIPVWVAGLLLVVIAGVAWLMWAARLVTEVRASGLYIRFFPFHRSFRQIPLRDITKVEVKEYRPIKDYGGWGIRYGPSGKAYNVSGNLGVKLTFRSGSDLLIGSQNPEELVRAIGTIVKKHE